MLLAAAVAVSIARRLPKSSVEAPEVELWDYSAPPPPEPLFPSPNARRVVTWCQARDVLRERCQRCHTSPTAFGAPFPLLEYTDVDREYPPGSGERLSTRIQQVVRHHVMPPLGLALDPPVEPLSEAQKDVLLVWLEEGALPFGGTRCGVTEGTGNTPPAPRHE